MGVATKPKSETRQRTKLLGVRLLPEEHELLKEMAEARGISLSELVISSLRKAVPDVICSQVA